MIFKIPLYVCIFGLVLIGSFYGIVKEEYAHATFDLMLAIILKNICDNED